jgi:hypothetical protein
MTTPIPENWGKCNFVYTEINHDLNPPVSKKILTSSNFVTAIKSGLDQGPYGCSGFTPNDFKNDDEIVEKILGKTIDEIHNLKSSVEIPMQVLSKMNNTNTQSVRVTGTLFKEEKVSTAADTTYSNSLINQLFNPPAVVNPVNLYFIIDTGDELIARYLKPLSPTNPVNLHAIHSMTTIGDSAMKKKPNAKDWQTKNLKVPIHSWYFNESIIIAQNHDDFMSNYLITCRLINATSWHIGQSWSIGKNIFYNTNNSNVNNNKPGIRKEIQKLIDENVLTDPKTFAAKSKQLGLAVQKKRSGDHLQIIFAKEFPAALADPSNAAKYIYYSGSNTAAIGTSTSPPHGTEAEIKARTYFVTGDWPAFCYACYLGVNSIIIVRRGYILRAWFS